MKAYKKFISFPKIKDYKTAVQNITHAARYEGFDEEKQEVIYNTDPLPTITFTGTVKLHGTNAGVCYNNQEGFWYQSRENIITPQKDNAGFAFFTDTNKDVFKAIIEQIAIDNNISLDEFTVSVYGEWAGGSIQKGVALNELEKQFYIFGVKISKPQDPEFTSYWVDSTKYASKENKIFNVDQFTTYTMEIDFNQHKEIVNDLITITEAVEAECPTCKAFGVSGVGEGVVWRAEYKGIVYRFKVKGAKHSNNKVKKLVEVDPVKLASVNEFVDYTVTENRVDQGIQIIFGDGFIEKKKTGDFLKWIVNDIIEEEGHTLAENGLEPKDVTKSLSNKARIMLFKRYEDQ